MIDLSKRYKLAKLSYSKPKTTQQVILTLAESCGKYMQKNTEDIEIDLLLKAVYQQWGYDFRQYSKASMARRLRGFCEKNGLNHISELIPKVLHCKKTLRALVENISVTVTEMFRNPFVYKEIRKRIVPYLRTYPAINIWVAGCATGEEIYSLAILLKEEGIYNKCQIYATDINEKSINIAKKGIMPTATIKTNTTNYLKAEGQTSFSAYYETKNNKIVLNRDLRENIIFSTHNLATDAVFNEMQLILCRNVLIYFNPELQNHALQLFAKSLCHNGFLILGSPESIGFSSLADQFKIFGSEEKIFQKKKLM